MTTTFNGITLSPPVVTAIKEWRDEIGLTMGYNGQKASVRETCRFILEDFADQYSQQRRRDQEQMNRTEEELNNNGTNK